MKPKCPASGYVAQNGMKDAGCWKQGFRIGDKLPTLNMMLKYLCHAKRLLLWPNCVVSTESAAAPEAETNEINA